MAWMFSEACRLRMRSFKASSGDAEYCTGVAPSTANSRSGMRGLLPIGRVLAQIVEEAFDFAPHFIATGKTAPVAADQSREFVALVDRRDEIVAPAAGAIHQQRLHVGQKAIQLRIVAGHVVPRVQVQQRLR